MDRPLLRIGSRGPAVEQLQQALNLAPSRLPKLSTDGAFGPKTRSRANEFQQQNRLIADGIVGPQTYVALEAFFAKLSKFVDDYIVPPAEIQRARDQIAQMAVNLHMMFGWTQSLPYTPEPANPRIAARYCAEPITRMRQGGAILAHIFRLTGAPQPRQRTVAIITADAVARYREGKKHPQYYPFWRNNKDIVSWCGIFCLYVYKMCRLNMANWPFRYGDEAGSKGEPAQLRRLSTVELPKKGDMGILWKESNHHFMVVGARDDGMLTTVEGNADWRFQTIVKRTRLVRDILKASGGFVTPIWRTVLRRHG